MKETDGDESVEERMDTEADKDQQPVAQTSND